MICKNRNFSGVRVPVDLVSVDAGRQQCSDEEENENCFDFLFLHVSPSFQVLLMNYTQGRKTRQIGEWQAWTKSPECQLKPQCIKICDRDNRNNSKCLPDKAPDGTVITGIGAKAFNVPEDKVQQNKFDVDSPYGLSTVVLPENLETIGDQTFEYNNFKTLDLPDTLKTIGISAFHGNKLESLSLPDSVDSIGKGSFSMNSITSLKLPANNPNFTNIPQGAFSHEHQAGPHRPA